MSIQHDQELHCGMGILSTGSWLDNRSLRKTSTGSQSYVKTYFFPPFVSHLIQPSCTLLSGFQFLILIITRRTERNQNMFCLLMRITFLFWKRQIPQKRVTLGIKKKKTVYRDVFPLSTSLNTPTGRVGT
ncbi:hypothetical protein AMECASPLE_018683 [Ameca splendens]|uniref:Uncharacterized protein n=1 Tax=Ameca splendens TaxID=208324 RepID=A0ABV0ZBK4_9TELE